MSPPPLEQVKTLTQGDREKIAAFEKELFDIEKISKKAMTLVGKEVKQVITGEKDSVDAAALVDAAKGEAKKSLDNLVTKYVPAKLPPWFSQNLLDAKKGYSAAYTAKIESFAAIKRFIVEKEILEESSSTQVIIHIDPCSKNIEPCTECTRKS